MGNTTPVGKLDRGRLASNDSSDLDEDLPQSQILPAEYVALAGSALVVCQQVSGGHIVNMDDIQTRIDIGRHPTGGGIQDHLARWASA